MESTNQNKSTEPSLLQNRLLSDAITPSELRIGNIVTIGEKSPLKELHGVPLKVISISPCIDLEKKWTYSIGLEAFIGKIHPVNNQWNQFIEYLVPVLLSYEILEKMGLEKDDWSGFIFRYGIGLFSQKIEITQNENVWWCGNQIGKTKFVHKFQNLVYALSGKELQVV